MCLKSITFSFDDGVHQDGRLIEILNRYNLKATFNLNSARFGEQRMLTVRGKTVDYRRYEANEIAAVYRGHEIAAHTLTHRNLTTLTDDEVIREVEEDRQTLSKISGYQVVGLAYPCGGENNNEHVASLIKNHTGIRYARTISNTASYAVPNDLFRIKPSAKQADYSNVMDLAEKFITLSPNSPQLLYIWGHSYDFDADQSWDTFEDFCRIISNRKDIFYGTNREVLLR